MIVSFAGWKGGTGKSTLCYALAGILGERGKGRVVLLDTDAQGSAWEMYRQRRAPVPFECIHTPGAVNPSAGGEAELVLFDLPPNQENLLDMALAVSGVVVFPMNPTPQDVRATVQLKNKVGYYQKRRAGALRPLYVFNRVRARLALVPFMVKQAKAEGVGPVVFIPEAVAFQEAALAGLPLHLYAPNHRAVEILRRLERKVLHGDK